MKSIQYLFISVLTFIVLIICIQDTTAFHAEYHDGPSCGNCHCSPGQDCSADVVSGACDCTTPDDLSEN